MRDVSLLDYADLEALASVHEVVTEAIARARSGIPALGTPSWRSATHDQRVAALLVLAEAYLIEDPSHIAASILKDAALEVSGGHDWAAASALPSYAEVARRRAEPGRLARVPRADDATTARWVETGEATR